MTTLHHTPENNNHQSVAAREFTLAEMVAMAKDHWGRIEANRKRNYLNMTEDEAYELIDGMISLCHVKSPEHHFQTDFELYRYDQLVHNFIEIEDCVQDNIESQVAFGKSFKDAVKKIKESYENDLVELSKESDKIIASRVRLELTDTEVEAIRVLEKIAKKEVTKAFNKYQN